MNTNNEHTLQEYAKHFLNRFGQVPTVKPIPPVASKETQEIVVEYESDDGSIYVSDISLSECLLRLKSSWQHDYEIILELIKSQPWWANSTFTNEPELVMNFSILHELGHYEQFKDLPAADKAKLEEKYNKDSSGLSQYPIESRERAKAYRKIPLEKEADDFALEKLEDFLTGKD